MNTSIVVGLGFGDEGKGLVTSFLCSRQERPLIIRYNGGFQAGHTVIWKGTRHVFSSFGSGTLQDRPTFWSKYCPIYPPALLKEREVLLTKHIDPILYIDPDCPVATPFDVTYNQLQERSKNHGSVGVGFGATIDRHENHYRLYARDLLYDDIYSNKLNFIIDYYNYEKLMYDKWENQTNLFKSSVKEFQKLILSKKIQIKPLDEVLCEDRFDNIIFEGAQGILLDMDYGFFPHVTRSHTTIKNASQIIKDYDLKPPEVYYVTRTYQTRHGIGPMAMESDLDVKNNEFETNKYGQWQGAFRRGYLTLDYINYALSCDSQYPRNFNLLFVTCNDQFRFNVKLQDRHTTICYPEELRGHLKVDLEAIFKSSSPESSADILTL